MKIRFINDDKYICYVNKYYYTFSKDTINDFLMKMLKFIKKIYNLEMFGNYDIKCYIDKSYGIILEINKETDAFSKYTKKANINIDFIYEKFLFEIDDYFLTKNKVYKHKNKYYIENDYTNIMEHYNSIIYGIDKYKILHN